MRCCPPNPVRFLAAMPGYIYAQDRDDAVYVNLHVSSDALRSRYAYTVIDTAARSVTNPAAPARRVTLIP